MVLCIRPLVYDSLKSTNLIICLLGNIVEIAFVFSPSSGRLYHTPTSKKGSSAALLVHIQGHATFRYALCMFMLNQMTVTWAAHV
jgi:hypothetical protein